MKIPQYFMNLYDLVTGKKKKEEEKRLKESRESVDETAKKFLEEVVEKTGEKKKNSPLEKLQGNPAFFYQAINLLLEENRYVDFLKTFNFFCTDEQYKPLFCEITRRLHQKLPTYFRVDLNILVYKGEDSLRKFIHENPNPWSIKNRVKEE